MRERATKRGLKLTEIGFGAAQLGNLYRLTSDVEARSAVASAWDSGIRYFDTAPHYGLGLSERRLGGLLSELPRDEIVVSSKVGRLLVPTPEAAGLRDCEGFDVPATSRREWDFSREGILRSVDATLERTGLDRIDILYLHDPDDHIEAAFSTGIDTLIELRDQGVVSAVGAGMNQAGALAELIRRADVDLVMLAGRYTLLDHDAAKTLMPLAESSRVRVAVAGVYNSGLLSTARPAPDAMFDYALAPPELIARANAIADICEQYGTTLPDAALAFPLRHPAVVSVVVGVRDGRQVEQTISRYSAEIPPELWNHLHAAGLIPDPIVHPPRQDHE